MDFDTELKYQDTKKKLEEIFGGGMDEQVILFLIGVQELGRGFRTFSKDEKMNLMHVAICTLLEPYGYYRFDGKDDDGWPHFETLKKLPPLDKREQQDLIKIAIIEYFEKEGLGSIEDLKTS